MKKIFIHGWGFSKDVWKDYYYIDDALFLDLPFHGESTDKLSSIEDFARIVSDRIDEPSVLVGWSVGATVSLLTSLINPNVKTLVLVGFSPKFSDEELGSSPKMVKAFFHNLRRDYECTVLNFRKSAVGSVYPCPFPKRDGATKLLKDFADLDITGLLENVKVKTFLINGTNDRIVNKNAAFFSKERIKDSEVIFLNSHHGPFLEWDLFELLDD
ncbi:MAG: alpha/beta hydrolase [Hydrogenothermaceae bacterium]|nr:alpha/beta hydrolase [Hydrogenothermaceae bacterium]